MGDDVARRIEQRLRLPHGWMDHPHPHDYVDGEVVTPRLPAPGAGRPPPTLTETLDALASQLARADPSVRDAVARLMLRYLDSPAAGAKIARAIEQLLDGADDPPA